MKVSIFTKEGKRVGAEDKITAFKDGLIRGIVRILIFNNKGQVFLQKRNKDMEIAPDTWDNSVGGHVDEGESFVEAAHRETLEELGVENLELQEISQYYFEESTQYGLGKSFDTLYSAKYSGAFVLQQEEIQDGKWFDLDYCTSEVERNPKKFAPGLKRVLQEFLST